MCTSAGLPHPSFLVFILVSPQRLVTHFELMDMKPIGGCTFLHHPLPHLLPAGTDKN